MFRYCRNRTSLSADPLQMPLFYGKPIARQKETMKRTMDHPQKWIAYKIK